MQIPRVTLQIRFLHPHLFYSRPEKTAAEDVDESPADMRSGKFMINGSTGKVRRISGHPLYDLQPDKANEMAKGGNLPEVQVEKIPKAKPIKNINKIQQHKNRPVR